MSSEASPSDVSDAGGVSGSLVFALLKRNRALLHAWGQKARDPEFRPQVYSVLSLIASSPGISQSELAVESRADQAQLSGMLGSLESRGLIARRRNSTDERRRGNFLTPEGSQHFAALREEFRAFESQVSQRFTDAERRTLLTLLSKLDP